MSTRLFASSRATAPAEGDASGLLARPTMASIDGRETATGGEMAGFRIGVIAVLALAGSGCASIIKGGGSQSINIRSTPAEADVKVIDVATGNTVSTGKTPLVIPLKKSRGYFAKGQYKVVVEKPGFEAREVQVVGRPSGWYIGGNLVLGGLIGWLIVDPATGAMWTLDPEELSLELTPVAASASPDAPAATAAAPIALMTLDELSEQHPGLVSKLKPVQP
jgi:hypothetical protein